MYRLDDTCQRIEERVVLLATAPDADPHQVAERGERRAPRCAGTCRPGGTSSVIPDSVRERDLVGYGPNPPAFTWPDGATVVVNLVLVYEEGSESSVLWGDDRNEGWGEYADPGVQPPQRDRGTEAHYEYGSRAGVWRLARIFDEAGVPVTVSAAAVALELNPAVPAWMRERDHDLMGHGWRWIQLWGLTRGEEREHLRRAIESYERTLGHGRSAGTAPHGRAKRPASCSSRRAAFSTTRTPAPTTSRTTSAAAATVSRRAVLEDLQRQPLPHESRVREPSRLPGDAHDGSRRARARRAHRDDDSGVHARWSGQAARAAAPGFLEHALRTPRVSFMRRVDIARWWLETYPPVR